MDEAIGRLIAYFSYPFVRHAFAAGVMISLCASLLGVTLVLKRFSFIGDGLSHFAFGVTAIAAAVGLTNQILLVLPVTVICAVALLRSGQSAKIKGDAAIAMVSAGALAIGYWTMNVFSKSSNIAGDVCATLFGSASILTLSAADVWVCAALSCSVIVFYALYYKKIFAVTFDEEFAAASGVKAKTYNLTLAVVIAVVVVLAMNLVGALLISALVVFPALSAMRVFKSFFAVSVCSVIVSAVCAAGGLLISVLAGTPVGPTIVAVEIAGFLMLYAAGSIKRKA
ncbi:MAG: metal ABC transporter permease [Defluviitaleaceae bacterium]|nr:metal ABC transporter permease [Defluviitaleaceae bacterium]